MGLTEIDPSASSTNGLAAPFALELGRSDCRRCTGVRVLGNHCGLVNLVMTILLHLQRLTVTGSRRDRGGWRLVARTMAPAVGCFHQGAGQSSCCSFRTYASSWSTSMLRSHGCPSRCACDRKRIIPIKSLSFGFNPLVRRPYQPTMCDGGIEGQSTLLCGIWMHASTVIPIINKRRNGHAAKPLV